MAMAFVVAALMAMPALPVLAQHEHHTPAQPPTLTPQPPLPPALPPARERGSQAEIPDDIQVYSLEDLEKRALEKNPAMAQAEAAVRAADAQRLQAGLLPNPVIGYTAEDVPLDDTSEGKHGVFVAQEIPLGGKLRLSRKVLEQDLEQTRIAGESQRLLLLSELRRLYYRSLAAQARVDLRERLADLTREAVEVTKQLYNTGAADAPDQLAVENEALLREADLSAARIELDQTWAMLRALVADPDLEPGRLAGDLAQIPDLDRGALRDRLLEQSPELRVARARAVRAEAALARAKAERYPDLEIEAGVRQPRGNSSRGSNDREAFADVGFRVPLFNRNQGGIAAAEAEAARARLEEQRVLLTLEARFADTFGRYRQASQRAETYRNGVLERTRLAYQQYMAQYQQMMAAYPQVLITERTLIQSEEGYVDALARAWDAAMSLQSLLPAESAGMLPSFDNEMGGSSETRH
jgi:cobalt-zinc-cadmium efflux system outer membrane protein